MVDINLLTVSSLLLTISSGFMALLMFSTTMEQSKLKKLWGTVCTSIFFWGLGAFFISITDNPQQAELLWRLTHVGVALIPTLFIHFIYEFIGYKNKVLVRVFYAISLFFIYLALYTDTLISGVDRLFGQFYYDTPPGDYYWIFLGYFLLHFLYGVYLLWIKYHKEKNNAVKRQIKYLLVGVVVGYIGGAQNFATVYFPSIYPIGNFAVFLFPFIVGYAVIRLKLFKIKIVTAQFLTFLLILIIMVRLFLSQNNLDLILNIFLLVAAAILSVYLVRTFINEVKTRERAEELTEELQEANERLQFMDKQKSEMLSIASHQFRSPLTAIKGYTALIKKGSYGKIPNKLMEPINRIFKSSSNLAHVVDDFLNISRIEQGRMDYDFEQADVKAIVKEVVEEAEATVRDEGLSLSFTSDQTKHYPARLDVSKFKQVITNLVDNAIKYTEEGSVTVQLVRRNRKIEVSVEDTGIGIKPEDTEAIFEQFSRADEANDVNVIGTGLGLYIAKQIVEAHGGKIWASSPGKGKGSTFHVEIDVLDEKKVNEEKEQDE